MYVYKGKGVVTVKIRDSISIQRLMPFKTSEKPKAVSSSIAKDVKDTVSISYDKKVKENTPKAPSHPIHEKKDSPFQEAKPYPKDLYQVSSKGKVKRVTFIYDPDNRDVLKNLTLIGSWDKNTGRYTPQWKNSAVPMHMDKKGRWIATIDLIDDGDHPWEWGVLADAPRGKQQWAIFEEGNLKFNLKEDNLTFEYAPTTYTRMGAVKGGDNIHFKFWAPNARDVKVKIWDDKMKKPHYVSLKKDPRTGMWSGEVEGGWKKFEGKLYAYEITTSEGKKVLKNDPYARYLQGPQRGISLLYLHPITGKEVHQFYKDPNLENQGKPSWIKFVRFEVQGYSSADKVCLVLMDKSGKPLNKKELMERIGKGDSTLIKKFHHGKFSDFWTDNIEEDGRINLVRQGDAWASIINNPDALAGLRYRFEVYKKGEDGKLYIVGDTNKDGVLSSEEAINTPYNDPYSNLISEKFGWQRFGIIKESKFDWKYDNTPRMASDKNKMVIYQLHIGSIFGKAENVDRSTIKDIINRLEYFKELGVNTIEFLPTNTFEGLRDWGYIGSSSFAMSNNYGFYDENGKWVSGTDAVKRFIDEAHRLGFNVINDVVYNHWGGDYNNLWNLDGKKNPYFDWDNKVKGSSLCKGKEPESVLLKNVIKDGKYKSYRDTQKVIKEKKISVGDYIYKDVKDTPWGAMPAYNKEAVRQFIIDHAMAQLDEFHFDGLRFDFTHPIHDPALGGADGWFMLRKINREIHFFHPKAISVAEEFPNAEIITEPSYSHGKGGAGFDAMWNTEFQHRLIHDHSNPSILQQAARGWKTDMDKFMHHLIYHPEFTGPLNSVTIISDHDEVGNADRTISVATNHKENELPSVWARNAVRMTFGVGMLSPGMPMFFQGEESLANNKFKWGIPSTWDVGWDWLKVGKNWDWSKVKIDEEKISIYKKILNHKEEVKVKLSDTDKQILEYLSSLPPDKVDEGIYNIMRRQHFNFCKDVIHLRTSTPAFDGDADVKRIYTHNDNSIMAFSRSKNGEEYLIVASLNRNNLKNYNIPTPKGKWKLVLNSDDPKYGGEGFTTKDYINGGQNSNFNIPKASVLVYKKVD